jgi:hypothetical protein
MAFMPVCNEVVMSGWTCFIYAWEISIKCDIFLLFSGNIPWPTFTAPFDDIYDGL